MYFGSRISEASKPDKRREGKKMKKIVYFIVMFGLVCLLISVSDTLDSSALKPDIEMPSMSLCATGAEGIIM